MKIISDRNQHVAQPTNQNRLKPVGVSFAERMETGSSAKQVMQERALGFSEIGLLGLHYAHNFSNRAAPHTVRLNSKLIAPNPADTSVAKVPGKFASQLSSDFTELRAIQRNEPIRGGSILKESAKVFEKLAISPSPFTIMNVDVDYQSDQLKPAILKSFQDALRKARAEIRFALRIIETPQGIAVICNGSMLCSSNVQEFTDLAHQIAKDFSVTVRHLVVNKSKFF